MTPAQERIMEACRELGLKVRGPTAPDVPGMDGVVVDHGFTTPRLDPLEERGFRLTPSGRSTIIQERGDGTA
jgi:hypothetical protein